VSRLLKSIGRELLAEGGIEVCRGYMIERLRLVTPKDLYNAIKSGTHTMGVTEERDRKFGRRWSKLIEKVSYKGERIKREYLTGENVLEWLRMDRPDLASLIMNMNPQGMEWLREDVKQVYGFLFSETKPQRKPSLTLVKREQPKKEEPTPEQTLESPQQEQATTEIQQETTETEQKS